MNREEVEKVCYNLQAEGLVREVVEGKYSIKIMVDQDGKFEEDSIYVRDLIKNRFEDKECCVDILNGFWLEIIFIDIKERINKCFDVKKTKRDDTSQKLYGGI